ncbi:MAG TPA: GGDEF domain-containing protein [Polyangiaceae bacterium]|nr:GGDEF domain-containing protein [Polyangiaceae bacterium]
MPDDDGERTAIVQLADVLGKTRERDRHLLTRVRGNNVGQVISLMQAVCNIGRYSDSQIWLRDDGVSRRHARIFPEGNGFVLQDLGSANGTFVEGRLIKQHRLNDGELIQLGPVAAFRYSITDEDQEALLRRLYATSVTDSLTGAHNREHFDTQIEVELSYRRRHDTQLSIVLFDLDHFKQINDTYGHPGGDEVLKAVASCARTQLRTEDVFARYGGEEFAIILRGIDIRGARAMADRLRHTVSQLRVKHDGREIKLTLSGGCAAAAELESVSHTALLGLADRRLYAAKKAGRNRIVAED